VARGSPGINMMKKFHIYFAIAVITVLLLNQLPHGYEDYLFMSMLQLFTLYAFVFARVFLLHKKIVVELNIATIAFPIIYYLYMSFIISL